MKRVILDVHSEYANTASENKKDNSFLHVTEEQVENEIKLGKAFREAILSAGNYDEFTSTVNDLELIVCSTPKSKKDDASNGEIYGLDMLFGKVAFKLYSQFENVSFEWIRTDQMKYRKELQKLCDTVISVGSNPDADIQIDVHSFKIKGESVLC